MSREVIAAILAGALTGWSTSTGVKSQAVRLIDVWALGPLMIYVATAKDPQTLIRQALAFTGASTITYNARNYWRLRQYPEQIKLFEKEIMGNVAP